MSDPSQNADDSRDALPVSAQPEPTESEETTGVLTVASCSLGFLLSSRWSVGSF